MGMDVLHWLPRVRVLTPISADIPQGHLLVIGERPDCIRGQPAIVAREQMTLFSCQRAWYSGPRGEGENGVDALGPPS